MKRIFYLLLFIFFFTFNAKSQSLSVGWSDKLAMKEGKLKDGFFCSFVGENDKYLYAEFNKFRNPARAIDNQMKKLVAFHKKSITRKSAVDIIGYKEFKKEASSYGELSLYKKLVFNDVIYVFYKAENKSLRYLLVKGYSPELKVVKPLTVVKTFPLITKGQKNKAIVPFVNGNLVSGKIIFGFEKEAVSGSDIEIEYNIYNSDFSLLKTKNISLPIKFKGGSTRKLYGSSYRLSDNNKFLFNAGSTEYSVDLKTDEIKTLFISTEGKKLMSIRKREIAGETIIFGFYKNRENLSKRGGFEGVFRGVFTEDHKLKNMVFTKFSKELLENTFQNSGKRGKGIDKYIVDLDNLTLSNFSNIETAFVDNDGSIYLIISRLYNTTREKCHTDTQGNQRCRTISECEKSHVAILKINDQGEITWGNNYKRKIKYTEWSVFDVDAVHNNKSVFLFFGIRNNEGGKDKPITYLQVSKENGEIQQKMLDINEDGTSRNNIKRVVYPFFTQVLNNKFYVYYPKNKSSDQGFLGIIESNN